MRRELIAATAIAAVVTLASSAALAASSSPSGVATPAGAGSLPDGIGLGDFDGDGQDDLVQVAGNRMFVARVDGPGSPVAHGYLTAAVRRLVVGRFEPTGRDDACAITEANELACFASGVSLWADSVAHGRELRRSFSQPNPFKPDERLSVGDFNGDGLEDLLGFNASTGTIRVFSRGKHDAIFSSLPVAQHTAFLRGKQLFVGEFGGGGKTDLLVVDPSTGGLTQLLNTSGLARVAFASAFSSAHVLSPSEELTVANLTGGALDGMLLRSPESGRIRALDARAHPVAFSGRMPSAGGPGTLVAAKLHGGSTTLPRRDDLLFFGRPVGRPATLTATTTTYAKPSGPGYRSAFFKPLPDQSGWPAARSTRMAVIMCKLKDTQNTPDSAEARRILLGEGSGGLRDYLFEVSYGTIDIADADFHDWVNSTYKYTDSNGNSTGGTHGTADFIADCAKQAGVDSADYDDHVVVVTSAWVAFQGNRQWGGAAVDYAHVTSRTQAPAGLPELAEDSGINHETLHTFALYHANDVISCPKVVNNDDYCDPSDIMGNPYGHQATMRDGSRTGPGLNAAHLLDLDTIPSTRIVRLEPTAPRLPRTRTPRTSKVRVVLAPVEQPEATGALTVRIPAAGSETDFYTVAYRRQLNLDRATGVDGIQIHLDRGHTTYLQGGKTLHAGDQTTVAGWTLHVDSLNADTGQAIVSFTLPAS